MQIGLREQVPHQAQEFRNSSGNLDDLGVSPVSIRCFEMNIHLAQAKIWRYSYFDEEVGQQLAN